MKKRRDHFFVVTAPGLEDVCVGELHRLGITEVKIESGGILFEGELADLYRANLWLRTASRILVRVGTFRARDFPDLYRKALKLPWGRFLQRETSFRVKASAHRSRLMHTGRIAATVAEAIERATKASPQVILGDFETILVRLEDDLCTLSIDSSGELLHRRGYRESSVLAPLRETLAAGLLLLCGWDGTTPLFDPMCGSGTIPLEGALIAINRAPGLHRRFAFMEWPRYRAGLWDALLLETRRGERPCLPTLSGFDRDKKAANAACANAFCADLENLVHIECNNFFEAAAPPGRGLLLCNPPYGERIGREEEMLPFFREFGRRCRKLYADWDIAFLCPDPGLADATDLKLKIVGSLVNGGIPVKLYRKDFE